MRLAVDCLFGTGKILEAYCKKVTSKNINTNLLYALKIRRIGFYMDFKVNREYLTTTDVVYEGNSEQSVEMDYVLPDYYPDIFKILRCNLDPKIITTAINGDKLVCEIVACVKIYYLTNDSNRLHLIEQKLRYSKNIDLSKTPVCPEISASCTVDYVNCRAINAKRIDVRGAICLNAKVTSTLKCEAVTDAFGEGIQLKKADISFPSKKVVASKTVTISENIDIGQTKPPIECCMKCDVKIKKEECKTVPDKMIIKGVSSCKALYSCKSSDDDSLQAIEFEIPFSQIIDIEGLSENFKKKIDISHIYTEITPSDDGLSFECEITLKFDCVCIKYDEMKIVTDVFSTIRSCDFLTDAKCIDKSPVIDKIPLYEKAMFEYSDGDILAVYDCFASILKISYSFDKEKNIFNVRGKIAVCIIGKNENNTPFFLENILDFEKDFSIGNNLGSLDISAEIITVSYNLTSANSMEIKVEASLNCSLFETSNEKIISKIELGNELIEKDDFALKLYFASENEDVFSIAKHYNACAEAILRENDLEDEIISENTMLLIPTS